MAKDNRSLGRFHLDGIMPAPRGIPQVEVTLDIDANGILSVSAKDKASGKENQIRIEGGSQLSKEEIEKMKAEAELNAESDRIERELVDKVNMADNLIFQTEKQIKEFDDKLTEEDKSALNQDLESLKTAHSTKDVQAIDTASEKLNSTWGTISTRLYQETQSEPKVDVDTNTDTGNGGDVEDTSYEEVK
jgi:molecular chaperone DnaK